MNRYLLLHKDHRFSVKGVNSGAEMATLHLARYLARIGNDVVVAAQLAEGECTDQGVEFWDLGEKFDLNSALERMRERGSYHLISAGRSQPFFLVDSDPFCLSKILISHDRSGNDTGIQPKVLCERLDRVVCVSDAQRDVFLEAGAPAEKVVTIRNGVDHELFGIGDESKRDWKKIVFVGALVQDKGLHVLLAAYAQLKAKHPELTLDIYGSADLWGRSEMFDPPHIEEQLPGVKFHGKVGQEKVAEAFQTAGICAVPSIWFDPFPLTAIEAQTTGCPVVTFDVGGLGEGVRDHETGRVLKNITEESLTRALDELLSSPERLQQMSQKSIEVQRPYFNWERVVEELTELQDMIVEERTSPQRIGIMSTWNQTCGLATYANFLASEWDEKDYVVFAEDNDSNRTSSDESNVIRCWSWQSNDWISFVREVIDQQIDTLLVNAHNPEQLGKSNFQNVIRALQQEGIKVSLLIHSIFTKRPEAESALQAADAIIVHTPEMKLEVAAYGVAAQNIKVITHGVHSLPAISESEKKTIRESFNLLQDIPLVTSVGFIQPHKGIEGLIEAIHQLRAKGKEVHACIAGSPNASDPNAKQYAEQIQTLVQRLNLQDQITFVERFLEGEEVSALLQASDAVFMNYQSQHYEASGACSLAIGAGANVVTSTAPAFQGFGGAVWHMTSGFPAELALEAVLFNQEVQRALQGEREKFVHEHQWSKVQQRFCEVLRTDGVKKKTEKKEQVVKANSKRILIQNRENMFSQRGGDTIVIEHLVSGLKQRGYEIDLDLEGKGNPAQYDLVHLINFALPDMVKAYGERAKQAGVPFVVTTLCEDIPAFHVQSRALADTLVHYVRGGQSQKWLEQNKDLYKTLQPCASFDNAWSASNASALIVNGQGEQAVIEKSYQQNAPVHIVPVGHEIGASGDAKQFVDTYGIQDFIFCVGRLESRKNQLLLAQALEDVDIPLVFAGGGFSYQPDYADAVKNFKRKGQTIVLDRLSTEMLASAYAAAKIHALPSWYELPGLVSLEAVMHGCNVVASDTGTTKDYLSSYGFYCEPDNADSIRNAVLAAYYSPFKEEAKQHISQYTWAAATDATIAVYEEIIGKAEVSAGAGQTLSAPPTFSFPTTPAVPTTPSTPEPVDSAKFDELAEKGFAAANQKNFEDAHRYLGEAEKLNPNAVRVLSNRAAVYLAENKVVEAKEYFQRALQAGDGDTKAESGLGMCLMMEGKKEDAYGHFVSVLEKDPYEMVAILQLLDCAYAIARYDDLEQVLRRYLQSHPTNFDIRYCLAGCLLKSGQFDGCQEELNRLFADKPDHGGSKELKDALDEARAEAEAADEPLQVEQSVVPAASTTPIPFDSIDVRIAELEELKQRRDLDEAIEGCDGLLQRQDLTVPQKETVQLIKAECDALTGNAQEAEQIFRQLIVVNPQSARAKCGLGAIVASRGDAIGARVHFEGALNAQPGYDKALAGLAFCEAQEGRAPQAWHLYEEALEVNPENLSALFGVIQLGYQLEKLPEMELHLERYLEMHPADLDMVYAYAGCLYAQERLGDSLGEVEKILLFKSDDERALELRGVIEEKLNAQAVSL